MAANACVGEKEESIEWEHMADPYIPSRQLTVFSYAQFVRFKNMVRYVYLNDIHYTSITLHNTYNEHILLCAPDFYCTTKYIDDSLNFIQYY